MNRATSIALVAAVIVACSPDGPRRCTDTCLSGTRCDMATNLCVRDEPTAGGSATAGGPAGGISGGGAGGASGGTGGGGGGSSAGGTAGGGGGGASGGIAGGDGGGTPGGGAAGGIAGGTSGGGAGGGGFAGGVGGGASGGAGGGAADAGPPILLEFAPLSGAGMGSACACAAVTAANGQALAFARSTVAECYANDGQRLTQCGVNQPVVSSGSALSPVLGIWTEPSRTNLLLHSRDLSQPVWAKVNMSCSRTAVGMRGDSSGASTCTASSTNGTAVQTVTTPAGVRNSSLHLRRRAGSGVVEVTRDNGATWTAVTPSLSTGVWRRVVSREVPGCAGGNCIVVAGMSSGIANPAIGIRIANSGDAVDVDFAQDEEFAVASSPILTNGTPQLREQCFIDVPVSVAPTMATGFSLSSVAVSGGPFRSGSTAMGAVLGNGVVGSPTPPTVYVWPYAATSEPILSVDTAGVASSGFATWSPFYSPFSELSTQAGAHHTGTKLRSCQRGVCDVGGASVLGTPVFTRLLLGRYNAAEISLFSGVIKQICVDSSARCAPPEQAGPVVWIGDSIVYGNASLPLSPPVRLTELQPSRPVVNLGVGSTGVASCGARYQASSATAQTLVWSCGVNDLASGSVGAALASSAQGFLADARARGLKVIITGVMPWKNSVGWTAGKQAETASYNAAMSTWASANGAFFVPTTPSMGGGGGDPDVLASNYDSGDQIHPNAVGALQLATLVAAQSP